MTVITLSTDFGWDDPYVGIMKGVILGINPRATLVDITHGLSPHRLLEAAFKLATAADYFPKGTIHLAVVDPGVGGVRRPIVVETDKQSWVGPDNGIFTRILQAFPDFRVFQLTNPDYFLKPVSRTFHGRDIFAPAAAHLSRGISSTVLGNPIFDPVLLDLPEPVSKKNSLYRAGALCRSLRQPHHQPEPGGDRLLFATRGINRQDRAAGPFGE